LNVQAFKLRGYGLVGTAATNQITVTKKLRAGVKFREMLTAVRFRKYLPVSSLKTPRLKYTEV
jgi:hypothetical protein